MSLSRKLARLEMLVAAQTQAPAPTFWTPERAEQWRLWVIRLLETMPEDRARRVFVELNTLPAAERGPLTRHVDRMAALGVMGAYDTAIEQGRPLALPEAVCAVLETHPDAEATSAYTCEDCGFSAPQRSAAGWSTIRAEAQATGRRVDPAERTLLTDCPLCSGAVRWQGFNARRWGALWERQRGEMAAAG